MRIVFLLVWVLLGLSPSFAQAPSSSERMLALLDERIASFDKESVDAAMVQLEGFDLGAVLDENTIAFMRNSVENSVRQKNPGVDVNRLGDVFEKTMGKVQSEYRLLAPKHMLVSILETYSKAELLAMAAFSKTEIGTAILKKNRELQTKASALGIYINTVILPQAMNEMLNELSL